jgi:nicotinamide mononucleotide adenylyltransferase
MKMKKILTLFLIGLISISCMACATKEESGDKPGAVASRTVTVEATVEAINYKTRMVTLRGPKGKIVTMHVDERARNFNQIMVNDLVVAEYFEAVALQVQKHDGGQPTAAEGTAIERTPLGEKPGVAAVDTMVVKATVIDIDYDARRVVLKVPDGRYVTLNVDQDAPNFTSVKQGDQVVARYTLALAISVRKPD